MKKRDWVYSATRSWEDIEPLFVVGIILFWLALFLWKSGWLN